MGRFTGSLVNKEGAGEERGELTKIGRIEEASEKRGGRNGSFLFPHPSLILSSPESRNRRPCAPCALYLQGTCSISDLLVNDSYLFHNINGDGAMIFDAN